MSRAETTSATGKRADIFRLSGVTKRFGGVVAAREVDFDLLEGEVHALVGENGAGKSTLMKMVGGVHAPDEGSVEMGGESVSFSSPREAEEAGIAMIPQELDLFPELSIAENLFVGRRRPRARWGAMDWKTMREEARRSLGSMGVSLDMSTPVKQLSTANRQMVAIARALLGDAKVVIMDEPTASLTEREAGRLFEVIADLTESGVGVVYISHRLEEVFRVSDRITVMRDGRHITTAPSSDLDSDELVRLMVGRELKELFSRSRHKAGAVVLETRGLTREGEFENVDLTLRRGEVVGLAGLIGAGRTELAQSIFGLRRADAGEIRIDGEIVKRLSPQKAMEKGIFYVPEERKSQGLISPFPISNNITLSILDRICRMGFVKRGQERGTAERFAGTLSIRGAGMDDPVSRLSGGNQQKVVLAKSLAREPSVLLLDEPTRGVDVAAKAEIYRLIDDLAGEGKAVLLISSELEEILSMSDRIVVMREGKVNGEFERDEATQEKVMAAAAGVEAGESKVREERG
ncbi:MAG: sugar ABC transporter ATP-binding protein [Rubrobacteraceae bacterium]